MINQKLIIKAKNNKFRKKLYKNNKSEINKKIKNNNSKIIIKIKNNKLERNYTKIKVIN